jgi:hypothetical protein
MSGVLHTGHQYRESKHMLAPGILYSPGLFGSRVCSTRAYPAVADQRYGRNWGPVIRWSLVHPNSSCIRVSRMHLAFGCRRRELGHIQVPGIEFRSQPGTGHSRVAGALETGTSWVLGNPFPCTPIVRLHIHPPMPGSSFILSPGCAPITGYNPAWRCRVLVVPAQMG